MTSVSSLALLGLSQEIIIVLGLLLSVAIILGGSFLMILSDIRVQRLRNIPTPLMTTLT